MKKLLSIILALALLASLVPAVFAAGETIARTHEFVIGLSAFNTADLKTGTAANSNAPELQNGTALWHQASMAWDAVIDGSNTASGNAIDPFMNFSATDKWAFAGTNMTRLGNGGAKLEENYLQTQVGNGTFSGSYVYTAFKVYVEAPGTYTLQASSMEISGDSGKMQPKVYFFKDGEATVSTPNKYPSSALVDYFYTGDDGEYDTIGDITVNEAGTYIVSFVGAPGDTTTYPVSGSGKYYNLAIGGIKLLTDEVASISLSANSTEIAEGKTTALSVSATYTLSGAKTVENTDVSFSVAPAGIVEVSDAGVVSAIAAGKATVTATYGGKSSSVEITVKSSAVARTHEYVIGLSSFNTSDLKTVSGFYDGKLYNQASMAWNAVVDGANTTSGNAIDPFMNLSATDKWAFAGTNFSRATPYLSTDYLATNVGNGTFSGSYIYTAFKVYVDAPGTYMLQAKNTDLGGSGKMQPKVYFFKDGDATVSTPNKYPAASEVAYFDDWTSGEYTDIGEVIVDAAGTYVVSFAGIPGDATTYPVSGSGKHYYLAIGGIKLATDDLASVSVSAADAELEQREKTNLTVNANYTLSGEKNVANEDVEFSVAPAGVVSVSDAGVVTAIADGTAIVTATYGGKSATVKITVSTYIEPHTHEYVIGLSAFNTSDLKTQEGVLNSATNKMEPDTSIPDLFNGGMYHTASMAWDAVIDGANTESGNAINPFMNLTKTDKWAFVGTSHLSQYPYLANDHLYTQVGTSSLGTSYVAFKIYVDAPGDYTLQLKNMEGAAGERGSGHHLDPKVYFFKNGTAGVTNTNKGTYPAASLVGTLVYDAELVGEYDTVGKVSVPAAGEYIVAFTCDSNSPSSYAGNASPYQLSIGGIKLACEAEEPNEDITGNSVTIGLTAIANGVVSADAKALLSESSIVAGNINSVEVGSTVTLKAADSANLKFLYWYNGNSGRVIADTAEYSFKAGTNLPIYAKYADANAELVEYFNASGELIAESEGTFNAEPDVTAGSYYKLFKDASASSVVSTLVEKIASVANFVAWAKDGKIVSYDEEYSYYTWPGVGEAVEVTEGETSDVPAVVLFENDGAYMLELVNFEGVEIIEKGILFAQSGTPTVDACYAKVVANDDTNQFAASSEYGNARAYVIYKDGTSFRVAYSK